MNPSLTEISTALNIVKDLMACGLNYALTYHPYMNDSYYDVGVDEWADSHRLLLKNKGIHCYWGMTKLCLVCDELKKWVIKLSFIRDTHPNYREEEIVDFCELEAEHYRKACDNNVADYFAATYLLKNPYGITITLQEKTIPNENYFYGLFEEYVSEDYDFYSFDSDIHYQTRISEEVMDMTDDTRLSAVFGEGLTQLIDFIDVFEINDLHEGNYGTTLDGRNVIFDYSGYC